MLLNNVAETSAATRFLYGGLTEEILMRFGVMSLITWVTFKFLKTKNNNIYWAGILGSSILFALGHLPVTFSLLTSPSTGLISYIILGNFSGGVVFGWLYWKKGLECAMIAHCITHLLFILTGTI